MADLSRPYFGLRFRPGCDDHATCGVHAGSGRSADLAVDPRRDRSHRSHPKLISDVGMTAGQLDLFDTGAIELDRSFASARRIDLDEHAWVEHVPAWLTGADRLFTLLLEQAGWEQRDRWMINRVVTEPRLTAEYPDVRDAPELLQSIAKSLSEHYGVPSDRLWIILYRDHRDSTSWHVDWPSCKRERCTVPVLTL